MNYFARFSHQNFVRFSDFTRFDEHGSDLCPFARLRTSLSEEPCAKGHKFSPPMPYAKGQKSRGSFRTSPLSEHVAKGARTEAAGGQDEWWSGAVWLAHAARYVAPIAELCAYVVREG